MNPLALLGGLIAYNYRRHLHGQPTICSTVRAHLPRRAVLLGWTALTAWLIPHVLRGYPPRHKES